MASRDRRRRRRCCCCYCCTTVCRRRRRRKGNIFFLLIDEIIFLSLSVSILLIAAATLVMASPVCGHGKLTKRGERFFCLLARSLPIRLARNWLLLLRATHTHTYTHSFCNVQSHCNRPQTGGRCKLINQIWPSQARAFFHLVLVVVVAFQLLVQVGTNFCADQNLLVYFLHETREIPARGLTKLERRLLWRRRCCCCCCLF